MGDLAKTKNITRFFLVGTSKDYRIININIFVAEEQGVLPVPGREQLMGHSSLFVINIINIINIIPLLNIKSVMRCEVAQ